MYKLSGHSLTRGAWFLPETQPLTLAERDSNSSITLRKGDGAPEIGFNDWLLQDDGPEGPIVWRVKSIDDSVDTETVTIGLEHVIKILEDQSFFSEVTTAMMAGTPGAATCTAKQAVEYVLAQQSDWVLGDFAYNVSNPYEFDGDGLYDAIETVTDSLEDSVWEYDMSVYPFKLHIRQLDNTVQCEMRGERNLSTLRKSVSRSGMYTRIYPVGKNDLHIDGDYLSENEVVYGRIDKIETDQSKSTKELLQAWALGRLRRHSEPTVTISISGMELATETGEDLDRLTMNKICRVPLPEFSTTITERIVKKTWKDWRADPVGVTINLANNSQDVTEIIRNQSKRSGKAAKGNAKQNYLFEANGEHLYYEVFDECGHLHGLLNMTSESLRIAFDNEINSTRSEFMMTSESLRISFENEISSTRSEFQMTSESLRISFENEISSTRSEFQMTSEGLRVSFENEAASLRSDIQVQAGRIGLVVTGEGTSAAINISAITDGINNDSSVEIIGDRITIGSGSNKKKVKVYIDGEITATNGSITNLKTGTTKATLINSDALNGDSVTGGTVYATSQLSIGGSSGGGSGTLYYRGIQFYKQSVTMGASPYFIEGHFLGDNSTALSLNHYHTITAEEGTGADAGKIIITLSDPVSTSDTSNHVTNFKIADTTAYKNGVLSARNNVKVNAFTANAVTGTLPDHRTFIYTTDAPTPASGTSQEDTWYLTGGSSWSSNKTTVYLRYGSDSGTAYAQKEISGPTPSDWQLNYQSNTSYTYKAKVKVGGIWYESGNLSAANAYDNGWGGCYGTVGLNSTTAITLGYGESVTVYAQAKATSGAPSKTNVASRTITAPADRYSTGYSHGCPWKISLDDAGNHVGNWWNFKYWNSDASGVLYATNQSSTGLYLPWTTISISQNGTYNPSSYGASVFGQVTVNVSGGSSRTYLSSFYCTIIYNSNGTRTLRCEHTYSATESIPFTSGSTHNLYY